MTKNPNINPSKAEENIKVCEKYTPSWISLARDKQKLPKGDWWLWMILAGRGFGKTRTGAESIMALINSGQYKRIAIIGKTIKEAKDIMVEGQSGLLSTTIAQAMFQGIENGSENPNIAKFKYYSSKKQIVWENGAKAHIFGGDNYDSIRGYQFDLVWIDEFAKFSNPDLLWEQVLFSLRLGDDPKCIMTTTPRAIQILKDLSEDTMTHLTYGSTFENKANLSARFISNMETKYMTTKIGRQELFGELILEKENTIWKKENIIYRPMDRDLLSRVIIGIDPAMSCGENSDETGIIVAGTGYDGKIYVLDDLSGKYKPAEWAKIVCRAYKDYNAGSVIAETNNGGDLVREVLTTIYPNIPFKAVKAIRGKIARAEPISILYESNRVFHVREFYELEKQMCNLSYDDKTKGSPDRVDALVWTLSELKEREEWFVSLI
ncbi:MAG: phage terminase large subunit [Holosporales bacterium]|jgi:predicted phage terminase large subunit-like protein|nr:phage terminase large subunit [Holosporales bacterium]